MDLQMKKLKQLKNNIDVEIKTAGYENIHFDCPFCQFENVLNRESDLGSENSITRFDDVQCQKCSKTFAIIKDFCTSAKYEWFIYELNILKEKKMYQDYIRNLCQGLETFFYQAIINKKFDRNPVFRDKDGIINLEKYNKEIKIYEKKVKEYSFYKMRDEFLTVFEKERNNYIPQGIKPKEDRRLECFNSIKKTCINKLRNDVVHKYAYRPSLKEIDKFDCLVDAIYWLGLYLAVKDSIFILNSQTKPTETL